ncbi:MAG: CvpA family protein [Clostridia bacterium]|nr:CvpA family protein [Clostridia bacterium]
MSIFDIIVLAILALAAVHGFIKGIMKTIFRFLELIASIVIGALGAGAMILFKLADMDAITAMFNSGDYFNFNAYLETGVLFMVGAFIALFIASFIVGDHLINKYVYRRKFKKAIIDRFVGMFVNLLIWTALMFVIFAVISSLEGTEYDFYTELTQGAVITPILLDYNPIREPIVALCRDSGFTKILVTLLNMFWPNFEYLGF